VTSSWFFIQLLCQHFPRGNMKNHGHHFHRRDIKQTAPPPATKYVSLSWLGVMPNERLWNSDDNLPVLLPRYQLICSQIFDRFFYLSIGLHSYQKLNTAVIKRAMFCSNPVPKSKCWDGSQDSKLPPHTSHVALPT